MTDKLSNKVQFYVRFYDKGNVSVSRASCVDLYGVLSIVTQDKFNLHPFFYFNLNINYV